MSPSLTYATPTQAPVRLWPLAAGNALLAFAAAIFPLQSFLTRRLRLSSIDQGISSSVSDMLFPTAILIALFLLTRALPPRSGAKTRWTVIAALLLALADFVCRTCTGIYILATAHGPLPHHEFWSPTFRAVGGTALFLEAALLIGVAIFFVAATSRARRPALGWIAACGLLPDTLFLLVDHAQMFTRFLNTASPTVVRIYLTARDLQFCGLILVFSAVALFAAILALTASRT